MSGNDPGRLKILIPSLTLQRRWVTPDDVRWRFGYRTTICVGTNIARPGQIRILANDFFTKNGKYSLEFQIELVCAMCPRTIHDC